MNITFSPIRMDMKLTAKVAGNVLTLNGVALDLSGVTETDPLEDHDHPWIVGPVRRAAGQLQVTLLLPHGANPPQETLFPDPVTICKGAVPLPPYDSADPDESAALWEPEETALSGEGRDEG